MLTIKVMGRGVDTGGGGHRPGNRGQRGQMLPQLWENFTLALWQCMERNELKTAFAHSTFQTFPGHWGRGRMGHDPVHLKTGGGKIGKVTVLCDSPTNVAQIFQTRSSYPAGHRPGNRGGSGGKCSPNFGTGGPPTFGTI